QYIQDTLRKNKEALKNQRTQEKVQDKNNDTGQPKTLAQQAQETQRQWKQQVKDTHTSWQKEVEATHALWREKQREFLKNLPTYKKNLVTFELPQAAVSPKQLARDLTKSVQKPIKTSYHIITGALDVPMKDQGDRPTCSAFAGIRGVETLMMREKKWQALSEQYFYWLSKPNCQSSPCSEKGSWVGYGLEASKKSSSLDIPSQSQCPYDPTSLASNETQIPLKSACQQGVVKVDEIDTIYSLDEAVIALEQNYPVVTGFYLTPNFYVNKGIITEADASKEGKTDDHSKGHSMIILGYIKLPETMAKEEGKICFVVANSWGEGWGQGGFGCLTEKWAQRHRGKNPFIAIKSIRL
ncbi:MAG: C1 family peptidase, partial [Pseudomonadota bacterium]